VLKGDMNETYEKELPLNIIITINHIHSLKF